MGQYVCSVSAWSVNSQGDMVKTSENRSSPLTVRWDTKRKKAFIMTQILDSLALVIRKSMQIFILSSFYLLVSGANVIIFN